ncbi:hypothetical protein [Frigoriflavimonas asaccharolytica]|uniref:Lipoprotein n=1 Tax=Frigoriflavimonas asaccharolytica TaxID=2735899 RepID=A0A8J8K5W2_9FLAO|nr:hypothetical protein [Frigoriflavimonas asaccharolytica]NRS93090.1 hypothetical protein [Frigoriflavimonas asaccharolytica]
MKTRTLKLLSLSAIFAFALQSCSIEIREDSDSPTSQSGTTIVGNELSGSGTLSGTITKDLLIKEGNYNLVGLVKIADGVKLTIEPGATFTASTTTTSGLIFLKGSKAALDGTASKPIVFTTADKIPGGWCGITVYGDAPILANGGGTTATSEDGLNQIYGGSDIGSNSGIFRYIRVEYGGKKIGDGSSEFNGLTFYAVGAGTILENIVSYKGTDDGVEFFGGTVSAKNFISYGNFDDSFDWQDGWYGQDNSNWFAYQTGTGNFGMEIESSNNASANAPKVVGITLIRAAGTNPEVAGSTEISAIQFKKHGSGKFSNVYIEGYKNTGGKSAYPIVIQDSPTDVSQVLGGKVTVSPIRTVNSDNDLAWYYVGFTSTAPKTISQTATVTKVSIPGGNWSTVNGLDLTTL